MLVLPPEIHKEQLISEEYRKDQQKLHENPDYGVASVHFAPIVSKVCNQYQVKELLDYGCGKARLMKSIEVDHAMDIQLYDPAIPEWSEPAEPCEMVACLDVLEHIEPDKLDHVLDDLQRVTSRIGFYTISTVPAVKVLPDGRNAHLIIEELEWWLPKILERWELHMLQRMPDGFMVLVMPKTYRVER